MMDAQREMTLDEWVGTLPPIHGARNELAELRRQLAEAEAWRFEVCERLGLSCAAGAKWTPNDVWQLVRSEEEKITAKLALAEQDARRYRWLRGNKKMRLPYVGIMERSEIGSLYEAPFVGDLDAAIDAAIAAGEGK